MTKVHVLMRHPISRLAGGVLIAGEVIDIYTSRAEPVRIAAEKNKRSVNYLWRVTSKVVKEQP